MSNLAELWQLRAPDYWPSVRAPPVAAVLSRLGELGLRALLAEDAAVLQLFEASGLRVLSKVDAPSCTAASALQDSPLERARAREQVSLWRLAAR